MKKLLIALLLLVSPVAAQAVTLSWQDNSFNEDGFSIERSTTLPVDAGWFVLAVTAANVTTFTDPDEILGACYRVLAFNAAGESGYSNVTCRSQIDTAPPVITITNPIDVVKRKSDVQISATITDESQLSATSFSVNGTILSNCGLYSCNWKVPNAPNRQYIIKVSAQDEFSNTGVAQVSVRAQ